MLHLQTYFDRYLKLLLLSLQEVLVTPGNRRTVENLHIVHDNIDMLIRSFARQVQNKTLRNYTWIVIISVS